MWSHSFLLLALSSGLFVENITATSEPIQLPALCSPPSKIIHGHYLYETYLGNHFPGAVIRYVCDPPFWNLSQRDHGIYVCSYGLRWENMQLGRNLPTCVKAVDCGSPPAVNHATYKYITPPGDNTLLSVVKYSCDNSAWDPDHIGDDVYICTKSGTWKNMNQQEKLPLCHRRQCNEPPKIVHGHIEYKTEHNDKSYLSVIKYTCDAGYMENSYSQDGYYSCDADQHWYNTKLGQHLTACQEVSVGKPLVLLDPVNPPLSHVVPEGASPWSALIILPDHSIHNGFLVSHNMVLTSREIFGGQDISNELIKGMNVYLGVRCRHGMEKAHAYKVSNVFPVAMNKFSVVHLVENVHFGNTIVPIAIPHENLATPGSSGIAAGWDVGHHDHPGEHVYLTVQSVEDKQACDACMAENYPQDGPDFEGLFCTRAHESSLRLDSRDSGLALEIVVNGTSYAAGLLSSPKACEGDLDVFVSLLSMPDLNDVSLEKH